MKQAKTGAIWNASTYENLQIYYVLNKSPGYSVKEAWNLCKL